MANRRIKSRNTWQLQVILLLYAIIIVCMISGVKGIANYIAFAAMLALLFMWIAGKGWRIGRTKELLFSVWFMVYYIVTSLFELDVNYLMTYTAYNLLLFFPILMCLILDRMQDHKFLYACLKITLVMWFALCLYTIGFYLMNPMIARLATANQELYSGVVMGGYQFAYGSSLLGVYLFSLLFDKRIRNQNLKRLIVLGFVLSAVVIYLTESTLTTFSFIVGIVFVLLFDTNRSKGKSLMKRLFLIAVMLSLVIIGYIVLDTNATSISTWLSGKRDVLFYRRVEELFDSVFFDTQTGHYNKRTGLIMISWDTFLSNPIWGTGYKYGNVFSAGKLAGIGNHSELMDILARHGIVGAIPLFGLYCLVFKRFRGSHVGIVVAFLFMMFCNPFRTFSSHLILFLLLPLMERIISGTQKPIGIESGSRTVEN